MISQAHILLVTKDETVGRTVQSSLDESGVMSMTGVCREVSELRSHLSNRNAEAIMVDIDPDPSRILSELGVVLTAFPQTWAVVVCTHFTKDLVLQAMQVGAKHFLEKENIALELSKVLQVLLQEGERKVAALGSVVISVFSSGGGCGATTVTVNLANELRLASSKPVLSIDLDSYYGTMSTYLGITSEFGIADVLAGKSLIDSHLVKSTAYNYAQNYQVLASPVSIESPSAKSIIYENLPRVLDACRQAYAYTVIDAPRLPEQTLMAIASLSDVVLIVFQLTVKDVNRARSTVASLTRFGISRKKIWLLANRARKHGPLVRLEDSRKAIGLKSCLAIRSDWRKAMKSLNNCQLLAQVARRSGLRKDFLKLASSIEAFIANGTKEI